MSAEDEAATIEDTIVIDGEIKIEENSDNHNSQSN